MTHRSIPQRSWNIQPRGLLESTTSVLSFILLFLAAACQAPSAASLDLRWEGTPDRPWPGQELWVNRVQDWFILGGRLEAYNDLPMRTAHILTGRLAPSVGPVLAVVDLGFVDAPEGSSESTAEESDFLSGGLLLGAGGEGADYRRAALVHHSPGPGGGLFVGINDRGGLFVRDFENGNAVLSSSEGTLDNARSYRLRIRVEEASIDHRPDTETLQGQDAPGMSLVIEARDSSGDEEPITLVVPWLPPERLAGGVALVSHAGEATSARTWFSRVQLEGSGWESHADRGLGPVLGAQHTLSRGTLRLTAQLFPLAPIRPGPPGATEDSVVMEVHAEQAGWTRIGSAPVMAPSFTATISVQEWNSGRDTPYRLILRGPGADGDGKDKADLAFTGRIRSEPTDKDQVVVAAFTGNHNVASPGVDGGDYDWNTNIWFPHEDIVSHVQEHDPDFLFFSGDQVYEGASPTRADFSHPYEDYLYKWYLWLWAFRDLTRDVPSVAIPDDHDVFHGNVWGAGGRATPPGLAGAAAQDQGGYKLPPDWVNMVQHTQASHLPAPWHPTPLDGGIETYYTDVLYAGISFAVLEDRKFKSPPKLLVPGADVWNGWAQNPDFDPKVGADTPGASLLGEDQEAFLEEWAADWAGGTWMKVVLSQTIFGNVATIPADAMSGSVIPSLGLPTPGEYVEGDKMAADMDSNGWPPSGRARAIRAMRKGFAVHLAGDQHLASTVQYGVEAFRDGPYALCVPSVANFWPRRWYPPFPGENRDPDAPPYTGDFQDGFGNLMTVFAVSNPAQWGRDPSNLHDRAPGYGIARFNRATREVSLEAWPRWAEPGAGDGPYAGWPVHFHQEDGFGSSAYGYLPTVQVSGLENPVIQVINEAGGEVVYTLRIRGQRFSPFVPEAGSYTVRVGEPGTDSMQTFLGLQSDRGSDQTLEVVFGEGPGVG